jgi:hypothetical protein
MKWSAAATYLFKSATATDPARDLDALTRLTSLPEVLQTMVTDHLTDYDSFRDLRSLAVDPSPESFAALDHHIKNYRIFQQLIQSESNFNLPLLKMSKLTGMKIRDSLVSYFWRVSQGEIAEVLGSDHSVFTAQNISAFLSDQPVPENFNQTIEKLKSVLQGSLLRVSEMKAKIDSYVPLELSGENVTEKDMIVIGGFIELKCLYLYKTQVTDLSPLSGLSELQVLDLSNTKVTDLSPLSRLLELTVLDLSYTQLTDLSPL